VRFFDLVVVVAFLGAFADCFDGVLAMVAVRREVNDDGDDCCCFDTIEICERRPSRAPLVKSFGGFCRQFGLVLEGGKTLRTM
jgi:hypothetical protein